MGKIIGIPQYSLKHAAHMIEVSPRTIRRWIKSEKMFGYRVGWRKSWYVPLPEINRMRELYAMPKLTKEESEKLYMSY